MKILPKKQDIDREKSLERKRELDDGLALARRIDALRETKAQEEKNLLEYRNTAIKKVQDEIDQKLKELDLVKQQNKEAQETRLELLKPLNKEWKEVKEAKALSEQEKQDVYLSRENLKLDKQKLEEEQNNLSVILAKANQNEKETSKARSEAISLKELAQREYEMARIEHEKQTEEHDKKMFALQEMQKGYENAFATIRREEQVVKEKEEDLIIREQRLEARERRLKIVAEALKNNATSTKPSQSS